MIGEKIKAQRKRKGYSITELSALAGVSKSYLSYIERGIQHNPSLQVLAKIAAALDISTDTFIEESEPEQQTTTLDPEWEELIQKAINEGMSKEEFIDFLHFTKYKKWKEKEMKNNI